jgi:hypothetical protein
VVSPGELNADEQANLARLSQANRPQINDLDLGHYIRMRWMHFRNQRNMGHNSLNNRMLRAQRMFEGQYDPQKLAEIVKFGGSIVYSRLVAVKCRGATSLLRDVYLSAERPWDVQPQPDPPVPASIMAAIAQLVASEAAQAKAQGQDVDPETTHGRYLGLVHGAQQAALRQAMTQAEGAADRMDDILQAGGFYDALSEFLVDLPLRPFACIKGPTVRMVPKLVWSNAGGQRQASVQTVPQMCWERIDCQNLYWDPGAASIESAELIERKKLTRNDLNQVMNLPGYNQDAIRGALEDYARGLRDWMDTPDVESALLAGRESPSQNQSQLIDAAEYHGMVQGRVLLDNGVPREQIQDLDRDYMVQSWVVGRYTIKTQIQPNPRQRHPYYVTSFEKVPGSIAGHGLPDILEDMQEIANASLRSLVNNMSISSGPQVVINTELLSPDTDEDNLYPWKRWKVMSDPLGQQRPPVDFFQPQSNAQELMTIYSAISGLADDISAIPRYLTGESLKGGAGRTASGLSMLMGNAQKVLQTVAANVDEDVIRGVLTNLYDMLMLTDQSGLLTGDEQIKVNGVVVALQKDTEQQKRLQFLQLTANPLDAKIVGEVGRARVLRAVSSDLGLPDDVVPDDDTVQQQAQDEKQMQLTLMAANMNKNAGTGGAAGGAGAGGPSPAAPGGDSSAPPAPASPVADAAAQAQGMQPSMPQSPTMQNAAPRTNTVTQ